MVRGDAGAVREEVYDGGGFEDFQRGQVARCE